jgi:hypothetical protein
MLGVTIMNVVMLSVKAPELHISYSVNFIFQIFLILALSCTVFAAQNVTLSVASKKGKKKRLFMNIHFYFY